MNKHELRQAGLTRRQAVTTEERQQMSSVITGSLVKHLQQHFPATDTLLSYRAMNSEANADALFTQSDYQIFAPVTHHHEHMEWRAITVDTHWAPGLFGVLEPQQGALWQEQNHATVLICPLSAFDRRGNRLGMGKGCFDFWLAEHRSQLQCIIGLAFSCQEVAEIPCEVHDIPMNFIITENEVIPCPTP